MAVPSTLNAPLGHGVTIGFNIGNNDTLYAYWTQLFADLTALGCTWIRLNYSWQNIERTQGVYSWSVLDDAVSHINAAGFNLLYCLRDAPTWALVNTSQKATSEPWYLPDPTMMAGFATAVLTRYNGGALGHIDAIGYNEDFNIHFTSPTKTLTLSAQITTAGGPYTTLSINAAAQTADVGTLIYMAGYGNTVDVATVSSPVAINDTTVAINSFTPAATYAIGTAAKVAFVATNTSLYDLYDPGPLGVRTSLKSNPARNGKYAAAVINAVTPAVRAINSTIPIGIPCIWWLQPVNTPTFPGGVSNVTAYLQQIYTDAGANIDAYTFFDGHYYSNTVAPDVGNGQTSTITQYMTDFQNVAAANGDTGRQFWLTEFNWQGDITTTSSTAVSPGSVTITCGSVSGAAVGGLVVVDSGGVQETVTITAFDTTNVTITAVFANAHSGTYPVVLKLDCDQATQASRCTTLLNAVIPGTNPNNNKVFIFTLFYGTSGGTGSSLVHWNGTSYDQIPEYAIYGNYLNTHPTVLPGAGGGGNIGGGIPGITLAKQNITSNVDDLSVVIHDTLGQGPGAGSSGATQGRAATLKMNTNLGPLSSAVGAGQIVPGAAPSQYVPRALEATLVVPNTAKKLLVRQGEVIVTDITGVVVFGGYATKYTDTTTAVLGQNPQNFTTVEAIDYSTSLQRTFVTATYTNATDVFIIRDIVNKYVPWVKLDFFPLVGTYTFPRQNYNKQTVEQVFQTIAGITGYLIYVDYNKFLRYISPTSASSAPYNLSDNPDFVTTFPHAVTQYDIDDNSVINRVYFHGGSVFSNDFTQDLSPQANGSNTTFALAYQPQVATDGTYTVKVGGVTQILGMTDGTGPANTLISNGGLAQVLLDRGNQALTFNTAPPGSPTVTTMKYRYAFPLTIVSTDEVSHAYFGSPYLDGEINDSTVSDAATAIQRSKVLLSQQSFGLVTLKVVVYNKPGVQAGMLIRVTNALRGIDNTYLVQEVEIVPLGAGNFEYHFTLGAWNWNLIDFLLKLPTLSAFADQTNSATTSAGGVVSATQVLAHAQVHDAWNTKITTGPYYARAVAYVPRPFGGTLWGPGNAYPGFATVST